MASIDLMELAQDNGFLARVKYFMQKSAVAIMGEAAGLRTAYATAVLGGSASIFEMTVSVLTNTAVVAAGDAATPPFDASLGTEIEIENAVTGAWNAMSGVTGV